MTHVHTQFFTCYTFQFYNYYIWENAKSYQLSIGAFCFMIRCLLSEINGKIIKLFHPDDSMASEICVTTFSSIFAPNFFHILWVALKTSIMKRSGILSASHWCFWFYNSMFSYGDKRESDKTSFIDDAEWQYFGVITFTSSSHLFFSPLNELFLYDFFTWKEAKFYQLFNGTFSFMIQSLDTKIIGNMM